MTLGPSVTRRSALGGGIAGAGVALLATPAHADPLPDARTVARHAGDAADLGVREAASLLRAGRLSATELLTAVQARIARRNGPVSFAGSATSVNAWIRLYPERAAGAARAADAALSSDRSGLPVTTGIPIGLKDLYAVAGEPVTASSRVLDGSGGFPVNVATRDATVWRRLRAAGGVLTGHTHTHEFAAGTTTPQCGNPWDLARTVGGSSGGSAAALAARMIPLATGTDTGGSLRIPASCCGVSTLKPTYGTVSTYGVIPLAWTSDHAGVLARSLADVAAVLGVIAGPDPDCPATLAMPARHRPYPTSPRAGARPLHGTRVGAITTPGVDLSAGVARVWDRFLGELAGLGATLVRVTAPADPIATDPKLSGMAYAEIGRVHHDLFRHRKNLYGAALATSLEGIYAAAMPADDYLRGQQARTDLINAWSAVFDRHALHVLVSPVLAAEPPTRTAAEQDPAGTVATMSRLTTVWDRTGFPVAVTPAGFTRAPRLPTGMQIIGRPGSDAGVLQVGLDYQRHFPYWTARPEGPR